MANDNVIAAMSLLALRQVGEGFLHAAGLGGTAEGFRLLGERLRGHFSSHRAAWAKALAKANAGTWETLELALDLGERRARHSHPTRGGGSFGLCT